MADTQELQRILDVVIAVDDEERNATTNHPKTVWRQDTWVDVVHPRPWEAPVSQCRTSFCFAGWKAFLDGYTTTVLGKDEADGDQVIALKHVATGEILEANQIGIYAAKALGLSMAEAAVLFEGDNDLVDLRMMVSSFLAGTFTENYLEQDDDDEMVDTLSLSGAPV